MSSLPREVHEVLEHEYVSMYGPLERIAVRYTADQIVDVQWVLSILRACELADDPLARHAAQAENIDAARRSLAEKLNAMVIVDAARNPNDNRGEENRLQAEQRSILRNRLIHSPALTSIGRMLIEQYDDLFSETVSDATLHEIHRRIVDEAFTGAVKPLRDRRLANVYAKLHARAKEDDSKARTALCISGGGIRSATFAMGVIQGLASAKVLDKFDFLSTVSGGGYIGSWLSSWARRHPHGMTGVQEDLAACDSAAGWVRPADDTTSGPVRPKAKDGKIEPEPKPVRHLRDYSNYLSPRLGLFSGDAWTMASLYVRNLLLNLLVLIPVIALALALPRFYAFFTGTTFWVPVWLYPSTTVICLFLAFRYIGMHRPVDHDTKVEQASSNADAAYFRGCVLPLLGAAVSATLFWADVHSGLNDLTNWYVIGAAALAALATTVWPYFVYYRRFHKSVETSWRSNLADADALRSHLKHKKVREVAGTVLGLITAVAMVFLLATEVFDKPLQNFNDLMRIAERAPADRAGADLTPWATLYTCFAVPAMLLVFYVQATIFVGISSYRNEDHDREWWGRGGAWLLITAFAWAALSGIAVFGPVALYHAPIILGSIGGGAGLIAALLGFSAKTPANKKEKEDAGATAKAGNAALGLATPLFAIFFLALISLSTTWLTHKAKPVAESDKWESKKYALDSRLESKAVRTRPSRQHENVAIEDESRLESRVSLPGLRALAHYRTIAGTEIWELLILLAIAGLAYWLSRSIGVNKFSMHALYRNRLIRAYLGASRYSRNAHPFTGFDEKDDLQMYRLRPELLWPNDLLNPASFFDQLKEGSRKTQTGLEGKLLGKRKLAQHLWSRLYGTTQKQILAGRINSDSIDSVVHNLNAILVDETQHLEDVPGLGLPDDFWARRRDDCISQPPLLRNRAVIDHFFGDVISAMPRPKDAPPDQTAMTRGDETLSKLGKGSISRGPLHIVNVALNLVGGDKLAWQQRKAAPFTVSPYDSGGLFLGYRDSRLYGGKDGISLGTAVTISGAAASPNMGYHSSPAMGFLLTLLNVRLGWWLGNPGPTGQDVFRREHPATNLGPIVSEMIGKTNDRYEWVYLSDGGHFENLGLYEMVLRRCHYIVLSDAGADPDFAFEDLGNAIRKIRTDLGVPIDIEEMSMLRRAPDGPMNEGRYVATATIRYTAVDGEDAKDGLLIYLKPGIYQDDYFPRDVFNYAQQSKLFPHEPTSDQFFSESQFESYRALGRHAINDICCNYPDRASTARPRIPITKQFRNVPHFAEFVEDKARTARRAAPEQVIADAIHQIKLRADAAGPGHAIGE